jgi:hypothetical protein
MKGGNSGSLEPVASNIGGSEKKYIKVWSLLLRVAKKKYQLLSSLELEFELGWHFLGCVRCKCKGSFSNKSLFWESSNRQCGNPICRRHTASTPQSNGKRKIGCRKWSQRKRKKSDGGERQRESEREKQNGFFAAARTPHIEDDCVTNPG